MGTGKYRHVQALGFLAATFFIAGLFIARTPLVYAKSKPSSRHRTSRSKPNLPASGTRDNPKSVYTRYGQFPLAFEMNQGQASARAQFIAHAGESTIFLTPNGPVIRWQNARTTTWSLQTPPMGELKRTAAHAARPARYASRLPRTGAIGLLLDRANPHPLEDPLGELPGKVSYFVGKDRTKWIKGVSTFRRVEYCGVYPGVDVIYYGNQQRLEFDFVISPHGNVSDIALKITGHPRIKLGANGNLVLQQKGEEFQLANPSIYQSITGAKRSIRGHYVLLGQDRVGIRIPTYDHDRALVVDPVLAYSTYLGGSADDAANSIAVDANGDAYVAGWTGSTDFPVSGTSLSQTPSGAMAFVAKLNPVGDSILWSAYIGSIAEEYGGAWLGLDTAGNAYIASWTTDINFPVTTNTAFQESYVAGAQSNGFLSKISADGQTLLYSTYLGGGGQDVVQGLAVDSFGHAFLTGWSTSGRSGTHAFPLTANAFQTDNLSPYGDAFVSEIDTTQTGSASLVYSTLLGGSSPNFLGDMGNGIAVDSNDLIYVGGTTSSSDFPTTSGAYQPTGYNAMGNGFLSVIDPAQSGGSSLVYSTYLGGTGSYGDDVWTVAVDSSGKAYAVGTATSSDFPTTISGGQPDGSDSRAFVAKFDTTQSGTGSLIYSRTFGGSDWDGGSGLAVDSNGDAYVSGYSSSPDFPVTVDAIQSTLKGYDNAFVAVLSPDATSFIYASYWGGSAVDDALSLALDWDGNVYITGETESSDLVTTSGAPQSQLKGSLDGFVTKFALNPNPGIMASAAPPPNAYGWNNSTVTVSFSCIPGGAPIETCPSPVTVSTEGANQVVSGTAADTSNNTATASDTVNVDLTPPLVTITSPANNGSVDTPYAVINGTITDALSGPGSVVCDGVQATISGTNFTCTVQLSLGSNSVTAVGTDLAGNTASATITVNVSMATPSALTITPSPASIVVGQTQAFAAVDQDGVRRPDATWTVSDTTIASFVSGSPNTLIGNAAGQVTLTATIGSTSAQTQVTVSSSAPTIGTVLWTAPSVAGFTSYGGVQAVPTANGPDLYSVGRDSAGDVLVQALTSDGEQMWQQTVSASEGQFCCGGVGDSKGGLLIAALTGIIDFDGATSNLRWQYTSQYGLSPEIAVGPDGTVYAVDQCVDSTNDRVSCLDSINGATGALENQVQLPVYNQTDVGSTCSNTFITPGSSTPPTVGPDGSVYMLADGIEVTPDPNCANEPSYEQSWTENETLSILKNGIPYTTLATSSEVTGGGYEIDLSPVSAIPDGNGGVLAVYKDDSWYCIIADTSTGASAVFSNTHCSVNPSDDLVLGDNGVAFLVASNGSNSVVVSFNVQTLQQNWAYTSTGGDLSIIAATNGGGVTINDSEQGVIQLDSNGNASSPVASLQGAVPFDMFSWQEISNGDLALAWSPSGSNGVLNSLASVAAPVPEGNPYNQRYQPPCSTQKWNCVLTPVADNYNGTAENPAPPRAIEYGVFSLKNGALTDIYGQPGSYGPFEIVLREHYTSQNTDTDSIICSGQGCSNRYANNGLDYKNGEFTDNLVETHNSVTLSVSQDFYIERMKATVYWPRLQSGQYRWYGTTNQSANTTTTSARITQTAPLSQAAQCGYQPYSSDLACDTTGP